MAVLERIRSRAGTIVVVVIGLALLSFVLQDLFSSGSSVFKNNDLGEINGETIAGEEFANKLNALEEKVKANNGKSSLTENERQQLINEVWNEYLDMHLFNPQMEQTGVAVHEDELFDMVQGENIDPQVQQIPLFQDSITKQFDRKKVIKFLKTQLSEENDPDGKFRTSWADFEKALVKNRRKTKYNTLIRKAIYVTTAVAKKDFADKNKNVTYRLIAKKYDTIADSTIKLTDADYQKYYDEHKNEFEQQDESRKLEYVVFQVAPSPEDRAELLKQMEGLKEQFKSTNNDTLFVNANSNTPFREESVKRGSLNVQIDSSVFKGAEGSVYGPFVDGNDIKIVKLKGFKTSSDSVQASHILFSTQGGLTPEKAMAKADSVKKLVKDGADFAALATQLSEDPGSKTKGGDLGMFAEGMMVPEFNDACFNGNVGDLVTVKTQFGAHLIKITKKKDPSNKARVVFLTKAIEASTATNEKLYAQASDFASSSSDFDAFTKKAKAKNIFVVKAPSVKPTDRNVNDLNNAREIVNWAFSEEVKINDVSKVIELDGKYVVAVLTGKRDKGIPPMEQLKEDMEPMVKRDKKAERFEKEMAISGSANIDALAAKLKLTVDTSASVNFGSYSLNAYGYEPKLIGAIPYSAKNKLSGPVRGNSGVYVYVVENITEAPAPPADLKEYKKQLASSLQSRVDNGVYSSLMKKANVEDKRYRFF
ncbi:MAG: SurA N-terminal domain-containing protein [Bacteroidia bacterium]|jgi:peptidyl-prolyl cis-trans isomerase D